MKHQLLVSLQCPIYKINIIILNYPVVLSHWCSTTISFKTCPLYSCFVTYVTENGFGQGECSELNQYFNWALGKCKTVYIFLFLPILSPPSLIDCSKFCSNLHVICLVLIIFFLMVFLFTSNLFQDGVQVDEFGLPVLAKN